MPRTNATKVTMESVKAAVDQLRQAGHAPTVRAVSLVIGGGSYPLIAAFLKQLRGEAIDAAKQVELPAFWDETVMRLVEHVRTSTESAVAAELGQVRTDIDTLAARCRELEEELTAKEEQVQALTGELADEVARRTMLEQKAQAEAAAHMEAVRTAATAVAERDMLTADVARLKSVCVQQEEKSAGDMAARIEVERASAAAVAERDVYKAEAVRLGASLEQAHAEMDALSRTMADMRVEYVRIQKGNSDG